MTVRFALGVSGSMVQRFRDFELDEQRFELRKDGVVVPIQARPFRLIATLVAQRDRVVTKQALIDTVWDGLLVSDAAIAQAVMAARKALEDDSQELIAT